MKFETEHTEYEWELIAQRNMAGKAVARELVLLIENADQMTPQRAVGIALAYATYRKEEEYYDLECTMAIQARRSFSWHNPVMHRRASEAVNLATGVGNYTGLIRFIADEYSREWSSHPVILGGFRRVLDQLPSHGFPVKAPLAANLQEGLREDQRDYGAVLRSWSIAIK